MRHVGGSHNAEVAALVFTLLALSMAISTLDYHLMESSPQISRVQSVPLFLWELAYLNI